MMAPLHPFREVRSMSKVRVLPGPPFSNKFNILVNSFFWVKSIAIIGAGNLGRLVAQILIEKGHNVQSTYCIHPYPHSKRFDYIQDPSDFLREYEIVIFTAKVEFTGQESLLKEKMSLLLAHTQTSARFVYLSSDGIFDGIKGIYKEEDLASPTTLYGRNLQLCESLVQNSGRDYCIIRPSYLYGHSQGRLDGRLFKTLEAIQKGEKVARFVDMYKSPMHVAHAAEIVSSLAVDNAYQGILHIGGPRMSIYDFTAEALSCLRVSSSILEKDHIPNPVPGGILRDTSLDISLSHRITGNKALSVRESFKIYEGR